MDADPPPGRTDRAIVVGIDRYLAPQVSKLRGPRSDARRFYDWVTSPTGGAVPPENVTLLAAPDSAADANIEEIETAFVSLCGSARGREHRGRRLYIYLAGHGVAQHAHEASLLAADGGPDARERHVPGWHWLNWFLESGCFSEVILFADCCRTLQGTWVVRPFPLNAIRRGSPRRVRWVRGFAVQYGGVAFEVEAEDGGRGVFTTALLEALERSRKADGRVTASSINEYLHNHPDLRKWRDRQEPSVVFDGDLVFSAQPVQHTRVRVRVPRDAPPTIEGGPGQGTWPVRPGERPFEYLADLPRGLYEASVPGGEPRFFKVTGAPGVVDVSCG